LRLCISVQNDLALPVVLQIKPGKSRVLQK
jgi:hypothetical protein